MPFHIPHCHTGVLLFCIISHNYSIYQWFTQHVVETYQGGDMVNIWDIMRTESYLIMVLYFYLVSGCYVSYVTIIM